MVFPMKSKEKLRYLEDRWDDQIAKGLDAAELLRYRSNLLGSDLRITNFGGGNTSSKIQETDPLDGSKAPILWIKGSGGDIGSIQRRDRKSTRLNSSHSQISYAVFCLKKKNTDTYSATHPQPP